MEIEVGRYSRGYLPHVDLGPHPQFLTWHLADALPTHLLSAWQEELKARPDDARRFEIYRLIEKHLDLGCGSQALSNPNAARIVQESLLFIHQRLCRLHAWSVMPTHVHVLLTPIDSNSFGEIVKAVKGYTGKVINRILNRSGRFWQEDYYDRWIRDERHFDKVATYIEWNPVKLKLCRDPALWPWSSANRDVLSRLT